MTTTRVYVLTENIYGEGYTLTGAVRQLALGRKVDDDEQPAMQLELQATEAQGTPPVRHEELRRSLEATRADLVQFLAWLGDGSAVIDDDTEEVVPARRPQRQDHGLAR